MSKELLEKLKKELEGKRESLRKELASFAKEDSKVRGDWDTTYPKTPEGNLEEAADAVEAYAEALPVEFTFEKQLRETEEALAAIEKGTYGKCKVCGKEIEEERLVAIPETARCQQCMER